MYSRNKRITFLWLAVLAGVLLFVGLWAHSKVKDCNEVLDGYQIKSGMIATTEVVDQTEAVSIEFGLHEPTTQENTEAMEEDDWNSTYDQYVAIIKQKKTYRTVELVSVILGCIAAVFYVVLARKENVLFTVEGALILLLFAGYRCLETKFQTGIEQIVLTVALVVAVLALRDVIRWVGNRFSLYDGITHKIAMRISNRTQKPQHYQMVSLTMMMIWIAISFVDALFLGWNDNRELLVYFVAMLLMGGVFILLALATTIQSMNEVVNQAVISERFKVDLITNVSHDLRTPLTSILGYGELLLGEDLSPKGREELEHLNLKARYMTDLVDELFELTKISSGAIEPKKEEIDYIRLIEQTIGLYEDKLVAGKLSVKRHFPEDHIMILTDGAMVHQVFANLLGNAIKYSKESSRIHIKVMKDESSNKIVMRMSNVASYEMDFDTEEIMQRFVRGDQSRTTTGSGLGLAIAKTYTDAVGGAFHIEIDDEQFVAILELPM